jgi:acetoin:2,6-dichlorophenolindophenol oxidoreductase subunit beta
MSWDKVPTDLQDLRVSHDDAANGGKRRISYRDAIREAQSAALERDPRVFLYGEGIDDPAGVFGTTTGLQEDFGESRVFDTPICENTLTGIGIGASLAGLKPVLIHMRTDFLLMSMDQLVNHAAKWKYMFGGKKSVSLVVRSIIGGGWGSAAQHSQPLQALFAHVPGLKVVMPATAYDAKGLLLASIAGASPVIFIEHRWLYDHKDEVPVKPYLIPLGKGVIRKAGTDLTLIADSYMVTLAMEAAKELQKEGLSLEVIDLRTVKPFDRELILRSVQKTGRAMVLDVGYEFCGVSAEISAFIAEQVFKSLRGPVVRVGLPDIPTPASPALEKIYYPNKERILSAVRGMFNER